LLDRTANHFFLPAAQRQGVHIFFLKKWNK
jgi:hypothetical protein